MKEKLIYILSFALAFALVTGTLIYLNSKFQNIFAFNFAPVNQINQIEVANMTPESPAAPTPNAPPVPVDTSKSKNEIAKADTIKPAPKDSVKAEPTSNTVAQNKKVEQQPDPAKTQQMESPKEVASREFQKTMKDSAYQSWVKKTVKLYEEMDAKRAAKVILGYSDNIARDILFSMKKRKAAEILTEFKPEVATRIINFN